MDLTNIKNFYNNFAEQFHLVFADFEKSIDYQAAVIDSLLKLEKKDKNSLVLDCASGIGTQSLGLSKLGYLVTGSDLSENAIKQAKLNAKKRNLNIDFFEADFCNLEKTFSQKFDIVIAMDNPLPHMIYDEDFLSALKSVYKRLKNDGIFISSTRDYDEILKTKPRHSMPRVFDLSGGKLIIFQVWDWKDNIYDFTEYVMFDKDKIKVDKFACTYRAYKKDEITKLVKAAGFKSIKWLVADESGYHQPIFIARK